MWSLFKRPVKTWSVYDEDAPLADLVCLGFMPAKTKREAKRRAREAWPGRNVIVEQMTAARIAAAYAKVRQRFVMATGQ